MRGRLGMGLCVAALCVPASASATVYTVDTDTDPTPDNECVVDCTLREAVNIATSADTVNVPPGTYALQQGQLVVDTAIVGAGARTTTIRAAPQSRVISITARVRAAVSGVTITGGAPVSAAASPQGGGILIGAGATLVLVDSAVVGNTAPVSGGIMATGALSMQRSTVSANVATTGQAGGIGVASGVTAALTNSTVSGNRAETVRTGLGGGIYSIGTLTLDNVTVANNRASLGGGINQGPAQQVATSATLRNAIVAGNTGGDCAGTAAVIAAWAGNHNLDQDASCGFSAAGDKPGVNPLLGSLINNGGPTNTHALAAGSPAINAGASCPSTDQRGVAREGACDIGAYEYRTPSTPGGGGLPDPVFHKNVNALPKSGITKIRLPGKRRFRVLREGEQIPLGTTVDVRRGRVTIIAAPGDDQTADFYGGIFKLSQTKGSTPITVLRLVEKLSCAKKKQANAAARKKTKRRLWGNGKGRFRTKGKHSAATVVGTKWLVQDRCTSTLTRVVRGRVKVRDFVKDKTVIVRAGKRYVAKKR